MIDEARTKITERRDADLSLIEEFKESFETMNIKSALVDTSGPRAKVYTNILFEVKPYIESRENYLEKNLVAKLKPD